jgi:transcriptional regulator with XRE-family HTH domain
MSDPTDATSRALARNLRTLRDGRNLSQAALAKVADVPRATIAHLESGSGNPTLHVLLRLAGALQVTLEELVAPPRAELRHVPKDALPVRRRTGVEVRAVVPDPLPGLVLERMELLPGARMTGVPHTPGTREYLTCERGAVILSTAGASFELGVGDVVVFRGDQPHGYRNPGEEIAVAYSAVVLAPGG